MLKWSFRLLLLGVVGVVGQSAYISYVKGYFTIPDLPYGAYILSQRNGMRMIILDAEVSIPSHDGNKFWRRLNMANPDRQYLTVEFEVPSWYADAWSVCSTPTEDDLADLEKNMAEDLKREMASARLDAVCKIDTDDEQLWRGLLYSVPKL